MDLIGKIYPTLSKQYYFILVATNYFIKQAEVIPLKVANQQAVIKFIKENLIHIFGLSKSIMTDQGTIFKYLILNIQKMVQDIPGQWHELLSEVLQLYKTSQKTSIGTTPYALVFDHNIMLPTELTIQSLKRAKQSGMSLSDYQQAMMADLDDLYKIYLLALDHLAIKNKKVDHT